MPPRSLEAKFAYCFIVTYGRSGSTLLQGILNTIPGYVIRGENGGALYQLHQLYASAKELSRTYGAEASSPAHPWFGFDLVTPDRLKSGLRRFFEESFLNPGPDTRCIGFKEIRYGQDVMGDYLAAHLDFIDAVFPRSAFIFNSRRLEDVAQSSWWRREPHALEHLKEFERRMKQAFERGRSNYFWVKYDDYVRDPEALRALFDFLDEPIDMGAIAKVLSSDYGLDRKTY